MMNFKDFLEMWDTPGKQGESGTPIRKPSDGQPFARFARGGKPRANSGGMGGMQFMKKKMKKK